MKTLKTMLAAAILSLAVSVPGYAGDVHTPGATPPPPPPPTAPGEIGSPGFALPEDIQLADFALDIWLGALSLL